MDIRIAAVGSVVLISQFSACYVSHDVIKTDDSVNGSDASDANDLQDPDQEPKRSIDEGRGRRDDNINDGAVEKEEIDPSCQGILDCKGVCNGSAVRDEAGDCCKPEKLDCANICNGAGVAVAGTCCDRGIFDCMGVCGGNAVEDKDGQCCEPEELDCADHCDGSAVEVDGKCCRTGFIDCSGVCDGKAVEDETGECCEPEELDCAENCNGPAVELEGTCCRTGVIDCLGVCDGNAVEDETGECCEPEKLDCADICRGPAVMLYGFCCESGRIDCMGVCDGVGAEDLDGECCQSQHIDCSGYCSDIDQEELNTCCESVYPPGLAYPPIYRAPTNAQEQFERHADLFLATTNGDYDVTAKPIIWAPTIRAEMRNYYVLPVQGELTNETAPSAVEQLLNSEWGGFFRTKEVSMTMSQGYCSLNLCRVKFDQDYCGLKVVSAEDTYSGKVKVDLVNGIDVKLLELDSSIIPMVRIHSVPSIDQAAAIESLIDDFPEIQYPDGVLPYKSETTPGVSFRFTDEPVIFIRALANQSLEYRTAYEILIGQEGTPDSPLPFNPVAIAYVDVVDSSLLWVRNDLVIS